MPSNTQTADIMALFNQLTKLSESPAPLTGFPKFKELPKEIQLQIWRKCMTPRIVEFKAGGGELLPAMHACRDAANEIRTHYTWYRLSMGGATPTESARQLEEYLGKRECDIWINYEIDILHLTPLSRFPLPPSDMLIPPNTLFSSDLDIYPGIENTRAADNALIFESGIKPFKRVLLNQEDCQFTSKDSLNFHRFGNWLSTFFDIGKLLPELTEVFLTSKCVHNLPSHELGRRESLTKLCYEQVVNAFHRMEDLNIIAPDIGFRNPWKQKPILRFVEMEGNSIQKVLYKSSEELEIRPCCDGTVECEVGNPNSS